MTLVSRKRHGFSSQPLHRKKEPHAFHYLSQRMPFWVAVLSLTAYVAGNMMGQYGWHVFWASVLGKEDDSAIVYVGTVTPIEFVPDYSAWTRYGGDPWNHTFSQVPSDLLVPLPAYVVSEQRKGYEDSPGDIYSIGHLGSYATGAEQSGSHPGVDIRVPVGTPIRSVMNGIVDSAKEDSGFGQVIVIRHPNVPDPDQPGKTTTLYSNYAHLSAMYVTPGTIVRKGDRIGLSGQTGFATGPHLHFQMDREEAVWHPYWLFNTTEQREAGYTSMTKAVDGALHQERGELYTVHPMLYVQANLPAATVATATRSAQPARPRMTLAERAAARRNERQQRVATVSSAPRVALVTTPLIQSASSASSAATVPIVVSRDTVVTTGFETPPVPVSISVQEPARGVAQVEIQHDGGFIGREWERVRLILLDEGGNQVKNPDFKGALTLIAAYGEADFSPRSLKASDFKEGIAQVLVLPRGRRTLVIQIHPLGTLSRPMPYGE